MQLNFPASNWLKSESVLFFLFSEGQQHESACIRLKIPSGAEFNLTFQICILRAKKSDAALPIRRITKVLQVLYPSIIPSVCIHNLYTLNEGLDWCLNAEKQTMLERVLCDIPLSILFISRNRDASPVMLAGSQAWHWGFLTHHALFIVQSNRVCKMRITQHEENRGKGDWGEKWGRAEEGERSKGESARGGKRWRGKERRETVDTVRTSISSHFQVNPRIVFWSLRTAGRRKWIWNRQLG